MSSINSGMGNPPIASSIAGLSPSEKNSTTEKAGRADAGAAKTAEKAQQEAGGLKESEKSKDRDADGRQLYENGDEARPPITEQCEAQDPPARPRAQDPDKKRGTRLDLDA